LKCVFTEIFISQGSAATHLRCGGIFSDCIITNVLLIQIMNKIQNRSIFDEVKAYEVKAYKKVCQFLGHPVYPVLLNDRPRFSDSECHLLIKFSPIC